MNCYVIIIENVKIDNHIDKNLTLRVSLTNEEEPIILQVHRSLAEEASIVIRDALTDNTDDIVHCPFNAISTGINKDAVKSFLDYLYGTLKVADLNGNNISLLRIAHYFEIQPLISLSASSIVMTMGCRNLVTTLELGDDLSLSSLSRSCYNFLVQYHGLYDVDANTLACYYTRCDQRRKNRFIGYFADKPDYKSYIRRKKICPVVDKYEDMP